MAQARTPWCLPERDSTAVQFGGAALVVLATPQAAAIAAQVRQVEAARDDSLWWRCEALDARLQLDQVRAQPPALRSSLTSYAPWSSATAGPLSRLASFASSALASGCSRWAETYRGSRRPYSFRSMFPNRYIALKSLLPHGTCLWR